MYDCVVVWERIGCLATRESRWSGLSTRSGTRERESVTSDGAGVRATVAFVAYARCRKPFYLKFRAIPVCIAGSSLGVDPITP